MKLVDSGDSKSPAARRAGSSPAPGTSYGNPASMRVSSESKPTLTGWLFSLSEALTDCLQTTVQGFVHQALLNQLSNWVSFLDCPAISNFLPRQTPPHPHPHLCQKGLRFDYAYCSAQTIQQLAINDGDS